MAQVHRTVEDLPLEGGEMVANPSVTPEVHRGRQVDGLRSFTAWIKQGSYYHGLVARQGRLHECPHLAGLPLPRRPQVMPSESHRELQMKAEATATSSNKPGAGAMAAPATEAPVMETPITETPVAEAPVAESPVPETPARSDTPAPMETGGAGDGQSWAECIKAGADEGFRGLGPRSAPGPKTPTSLPPPRQ